MMKALYLEPDEMLQVFTLVSSTLASQRVEDDPDIAPLRRARDKIALLADDVFCRTCKQPVGTYAKGLCRPCYRKQPRLTSA